MLNKFGRQYSILIDTIDDRTIEIKDPFTIEFSCKRNNLASANTANFKIYNLGLKTRDSIYKDKYDTLIYRKVEFKAGYTDDAPVIFRGNIQEASSMRNGVDVVTEIVAYDGGDAITNSFSAVTVEKGDSKENVLATLVNDLKNVQGSTIGTFTETNKRGKVLFGNTATIIKNETDDNFFIDNEKAILLNRDEAIDGDILLINAQSGLLESPQRSETQLVFKMLFEPRLKVGQLIKLESQVNSLYNGSYKIIGISHTGTISQSVGGKCETTVNLWLGETPLRVV